MAELPMLDQHRGVALVRSTDDLLRPIEDRQQHPKGAGLCGELGRSEPKKPNLMAVIDPKGDCRSPQSSTPTCLGRRLVGASTSAVRSATRPGSSGEAPMQSKRGLAGEPQEPSSRLRDLAEDPHWPLRRSKEAKKPR